MSEELQRAITAGVIVKTQGGCRCEVCDRDVPEIEPHLRGKDHFNNLAWEALRDPAPHPFLLDVIPSVVRGAKDRKELELVDKTFFSYRCLVCSKKSSGIKSLETHLKGKEHERAKKVMPLSHIPPLVPQTHPTSVRQPQFPPSSQPTGIQNTSLPVVPQNPGPQPYQLPGSQPPFHLQPWHPQTDSFQNQYPSGNPQPPLRQTPVSQSLTQSPMPTYNPPPQPTMRTLPHTSAIGTSRPNPPMQAVPISQLSPSPSVEAAGATGLDPELQRALNEGMVERGGDGHAFTCRICEKNVNGPAPCLEHLRSEKHKRKALTRMQQPPPDTERPQQATDGLLGRAFESLSIGTGRRNQVDGLWEFPWEVVTLMQLIMPNDRIYPNLSMPRGLVLIFNYYFTGGEHERWGARRDSFNLRTLFHRMGYLVYLYEDLSKSQTEQALTNSQADPCLRNYDSFIVFILSHGKDDQTFHTASGLEEDCLKLDDVRYRFTDTECPALKDKPKLFFANFCRGKHVEPQTAYDGMAPQRQPPRDMITLYSCINTFKTPRDRERGTYFVQVWCQVLAAHAYNEELRDLHHRACQAMLEMDGSTPELQEYFFKKFYFNPVHAQY